MKVKRKFKRDSIQKGLSAICVNNSLRGWDILENNVHVGGIYNVSYNRGPMGRGDDSNQWVISFTAQDKNVILSKKFEVNQIKEVKKYALEAYEMIIDDKDGKYKDMKDRIMKVRERRGLN